MKITFLGTGSPEGMPILSCDCEWCMGKSRPRTRPAILLQTAKANIILDLGPDIRSQLLRQNHIKRIKKIDAIFITHAHFDQIWGIGDVDQLHWIGKDIKIYANNQTIKYVRKFFPWVSNKIQIFNNYNTKKVGDIEIYSIPVQHSQRKEIATSGYVIKHKGNKTVYIPDIRDISRKALKEISRPEILIIDGQYILGKYIEDDDHIGGKELQKLIKNIKAKKVFLIAFSEHWYKTSSKNAESKLSKEYHIPNDDECLEI